jgi:malate synthase
MVNPKKEELERQRQELQELINRHYQAIEVLTGRPEKRQSVYGFPYNLLERSIHWGLDILEQAVARLVNATATWLQKAVARSRGR